VQEVEVEVLLMLSDFCVGGFDIHCVVLFDEFFQGSVSSSSGSTFNRK
jgi:hypothetical protein